MANKPTSENRINANRKNAQKSTGPTSDAGKARSSKNALKHGLTSRDVVLPNENSEAFEERRRDWMAYHQPRDPLHQFLVERAVQASWRLDRCTRHETANASMRVRHAETVHTLDAKKRADDLGKRLFFEPISRCETPQVYHPVVRERLERRDRDHPAALARELESFAEGVDWMITRWHDLKASLDRQGFWHYTDKYKAIYLLGKRPCDLLDDRTVAWITVSCHAAHPEAWDEWDDAHQSRLGIVGKPMYVHEIGAVYDQSPETPEDGRANLEALVATQLIRLDALLSSGISDRAKADLESAQSRVLFDDTSSGVNLRRYETACERTLEHAINHLAKRKKNEPEPEPIGGDEDEAESQPENHAPPEPALAPTVPPEALSEPVLRNEPIAEPQPAQENKAERQAIRVRGNNVSRHIPVERISKVMNRVHNDNPSHPAPRKTRKNRLDPTSADPK